MSKKNTVISNVIALHKSDLIEIVNKALKIGEVQSEILKGDAKPTMPQNKAYKIYGRGTIERWLEQGIIHRYCDYGVGVENTAFRYSIIELMIASLSNNYIKSLSEKEKEEFRKAIPLTNYLKK